MPDVSGRSLKDAKQALRSAGFGNVVDGTCSTDASAGAQQKATDTSPGAGSVVNRNSSISVNYASAICAGFGGGNGGGNGGNGGGNG